MAWGHAGHADASARRFIAAGARRLSSQGEPRPHVSEAAGKTSAPLKAEEILTGALGKVLELVKLEKVNSARISVRKEGSFFI